MDEQKFHLKSPDEQLQITVSVDSDIRWTIQHEDDVILDHSTMAMHIKDGPSLGANPVFIEKSQHTVNKRITPPFYRKKEIEDQFNELTLYFEGDFGITYRAYNEGAAYRFFTSIQEDLIISSEDVHFNFIEDSIGYIPYKQSRDYDRYSSSFSSWYLPIKLSEFDTEELSYLPVLVEVENDKRVVLFEADLIDYPGLLMVNNEQNTHGVSGYFPGYALEQEQGGHNDLQLIPVERANYIAKTDGERSFPWRGVAVAESDTDLLDIDMVYKLASPSRIEDTSWIKPGQSAWEWWSDWNISGVDFGAGINTETYLYYIDFAADNGIDDILLDEGWSIESNDLMGTIPELDLEKVVDYANKKGIGVWLWAGFLPIHVGMDEVFAHYSEMGIKGFKVDFINRNDQLATDFHWRPAKTAAKYNLMVNFHGTYPPNGLQRTWPNAITFEGVHGLEYHKWEDNTDHPDHVKHNVTIPFIRMMVGPMDTSPGGMRNSNFENFRAVYSLPMTQGTRCHQLAMFIVYESPNKVVADNPTAYKSEQESVDFISDIPTTSDRVVPLGGKIGGYVAVAREKEDAWYLGAMTNWNSQMITIDFSFLSDGEYEAVIFKDGINAHRDARDYVREVRTIRAIDQIEIEMSTGGGWAAILQPID